MSLKMGKIRLVIVRIQSTSSFTDAPSQFLVEIKQRRLDQRLTRRRCSPKGSRTSTAQNGSSAQQHHGRTRKQWNVRPIRPVTFAADVSSCARRAIPRSDCILNQRYLFTAEERHLDLQQWQSNSQHSSEEHYTAP